jgi:DNA-directed RNA polymerase specialized sigma24 family protein
LDELAPAIRLGLLEELRLALAGVVDEARMAAMATAVDEGWGLRRIGKFCGVSHEQVRRILAGARSGEGR